MNRRFAILIGLAFSAGPALGGNPIEVRQDAALRWDTSSAIVWNPDSGSLGSWNQNQARGEVDAAFDMWEAVPTATLTFLRGPHITHPTTGATIDVTSSTVNLVLNSNNGQNPIIYDNNLDILNQLGIPPTVIGTAGPLYLSGTEIVKAMMILNGEFFDGDPTDVGELPVGGFRHVVVHEAGHFCGLNHSSVNHELTAGIGACPLPTLTQIETMKPFTDGGETPGIHHDDAMMVSYLYPEATFNTTNASIGGAVFWGEAIVPIVPVDGANVILRPVTADCADLYNFSQGVQAGTNPAEWGGRGRYHFPGLTPGGSYTLQHTGMQDGAGYPLDSCCFIDDFWDLSEDFFNPPDDPTVSSMATAGAAGTTTTGFDIEINIAGGPGGIATTGAEALSASRLDGNTALPTEKLVVDLEFNVRRVDKNPGDQQAWVNRYSPAGNQLPLRIEGIEGFFLKNPMVIGRAVRLLVYTDPAGTGDIANATLVGFQDVVVPPPGPTVFDTYTLTTPVDVTAGDFYIGFYDLVSDNSQPFGYYDPFATGNGFVATNSTAPGDYSSFDDGNFYARAIVSITPPAGSVVLNWGDPCNFSSNEYQDFVVYEGNMGSFGGPLDHQPATCSTDLKKQWVVPPGGGDLFWLVTPRVADREGELGTGAGGSSRAPAVTCETTNAAACP